MSKSKRTKREQIGLGDALLGTRLDEVRGKTESPTGADLFIVDNSQWLQLFKTVDLGDVIKRMVLDIQHWENATGNKLNEMDTSKKLTTLPSVYNVMTMAARPEKVV